MAQPDSKQESAAQHDGEPPSHVAPGLSRGWVELIGTVSLAVSVSALAFLSGVAPILEIGRSTLLDMAVRLFVIMLVGATLLVIALRQEGRKWAHVAIVPLFIVAVALMVIFIPLWGYFTYLQAENPLEYFRLFR